MAQLDYLLICGGPAGHDGDLSETTRTIRPRSDDTTPDKTLTIRSEQQKKRKRRAELAFVLQNNVLYVTLHDTVPQTPLKAVQHTSADKCITVYMQVD